MKKFLVICAFLLPMACSKPINADQEVIQRLDALIEAQNWMELCKLETDMAALTLKMTDGDGLFGSIIEHIKRSTGNFSEYKCEVPVMTTTAQPYIETSSEAAKPAAAEPELMELTEENLKNASNSALLCKNCSIDYEDQEFQKDMKLSDEDSSHFRSPVALIAISATISILLVVLMVVFIAKMCCK